MTRHASKCHGVNFDATIPADNCDARAASARRPDGREEIRRGREGRSAQRLHLQRLDFDFSVLSSFFLPAIMDMSNFSSAEQAHMTKVIEKRQVGSDSAFVRGRTR